MDKNPHEPLTNTQLAGIAHMAPTAFIRKFRQLFDVSPQAYYLQKRLEHACRLFEAGEATIDQIAEACGFSERNYFSNVFRFADSSHSRVSRNTISRLPFT